MSVSTWIDRVDLALEGARHSGRGTWTDKELYFVLGNKLMESAAKWWVTTNRKLPRHQRTWPTLKKALLRRYGERLDKSAAEWRVTQRIMMPGETYADFAAGLRDATGRNRVSERVLLAQFYRCLDRTMRSLVKQEPKPTTLEEAVDKAVEIDDSGENVAQGMHNIGQAWPTASSAFMAPMMSATRQTMLVPGVGNAVWTNSVTTPREATAATSGAESENFALFTNPAGVHNVISGVWEVPEDRVWNGHCWAVSKKRVRQRKEARAMAAYRRLAGEVNGRNEGRAARYGATVRPAMARDRYLHLKAEVAENGVLNIEQGEQQESAEDARPSAVPQHQKNDVVETEEGVAGVTATTSTIATVVTGSEQTDENEREQVAGGHAPPGRSALEADAQRSEEVATDDVSECTVNGGQAHVQLVQRRRSARVAGAVDGVGAIRLVEADDGLQLR
uniref:Retrotransposon gag domain-containing protein n=1 Tax=Phytophthora ramorum TaxID=164328 RepID=H3H6V8_PHYRM